ncbi:hypothetical protein [Sporomusa acidovorans]|uniref:hypothetical protein n=1 Tax=Sporomusa acidovorans TaxID=112900 RepID=UPI000889FD15|nr:hypothetical protein [Sporomusa acidovorans]OZC19076.1 hypothetical protein SPACI_31620 [Sporomusa acidovorans DSM 3132]SDD66464.1 hypothetical protein SAMN04488499_100322 [Sporomusa acidovorans]
MNAKKHFWQLAFGFLLLVVLALMSAWNEQRTQAGMMAQMMGGSMGDMMRMMHASNITLADLLTWKSEVGMTQGAKQAGSFLMWVHTVTTNTIFLLVPVILAGTVFLLIVWQLR